MLQDFQGYVDSEGRHVTELMVCRSAAGFYLGRYSEDGPYCRESGYFPTEESAEAELASLKAGTESVNNNHSNHRRNTT